MIPARIQAVMVLTPLLNRACYYQKEENSNHSLEQLGPDGFLICCSSDWFFWSLIQHKANAVIPLIFANL